MLIITNSSTLCNKMADEDRRKRRDEEGHEEDRNEVTKSAKAIRLLREVTTLLSENQEEAKETQAAVVPGQVGANAVLNNFRSIFAPYNQVPRVPLMSTLQQRKHRPSKQKQRGIFFQPKETWTHEFFCLARKGQNRVPSRAEKFELQAGSLGRRKICFHSKAKFTEFCQKLEEEFPKLKSAGGFVLLRTGQQGSNGCLVTITPPSSGYSVAFLRDCSGLGQATAYIRPLQRDLDTTPVAEVRFYPLFYFCDVSEFLLHK